MEASLSSYLNFAILTQCLFGMVYLSTYQWQRNRWFVVSLACIFVLQLGVFIGGNTLSFSEKLLIGNPGMILWVMPSLYLFTKEMVSIKTRKSHIFQHFILGFLFYILFLFTEVKHPTQFMLLMGQGKTPFLHLVHVIAILCVCVYYSYAILKLIKYNQKKYKNEYAETSIFLTLDWLKYMIWASLILTVLGVLSLPISLMTTNQAIPFGLIELSFLFSVMVSCYFAFRQPTIYQSAEIVADIEAIESPIATSPKDLLSKEQIDIISKKIDVYFAESQPFLNSKVKMPDIASALNISSNELSWYLNDYLQINFFTFINQYRIQYSVDLLKAEDYQHYTLEAISKMAGFRSKTTFNTRFKEIMGLTPSEYKRTL